MFTGTPYAAIILLSANLVFLIPIFLSYNKHHLFSKNFIITFLIIVIFANSIIWGKESFLIFFLIPVVIQLFVIYSKNELKYIIIYYIIIFVLFIVYQFRFDLFEPYAILKEYGLRNSYLNLPVLSILLFLMMILTFRINNLNENKIAYQKKYFEKILNSLPFDIEVIDANFKYQFINKHAIKDDKIREWIIGKDDYEFMNLKGKDSKLADARRSLLKQVLESGKTSQMEEIIEVENGKKYYSDKIIISLNDNELGEAMRFIGYSKDTTKKREAEILLKQYMLKLEKSNEEIKQFAYVTSHDLKSPLRNISSLLQLAKKKNEHIITEDSKELIDICIKSANSLYNIVNDVLLYTTSEVDIASFSKIDVNEVVYDVLNNINSFVDENNARVNVKNKLPFVFSHKTMIFNLFLNLIQNGIKYNKSEVPQVDIDFVEDDFNFIFSISDNGIGIDEKYKEQIFVVFKRLHTQQEYEGTGIGLSICKKIVENLNGKIWIDSTVGEGSTFFISLPKD